MLSSIMEKGFADTYMFAVIFNPIMSTASSCDQQNQRESLSDLRWKCNTLT